MRALSSKTVNILILISLFSLVYVNYFSKNKSRTINTVSSLFYTQSTLSDSLSGATLSAIHFRVDLRLQPIFILSSDLDNTLVGNAESLLDFNRIWQNTLSRTGWALVYNTGRSFQDYKELSHEWALLAPDVFIGGCGTQIITFLQRSGNLIPMQDMTWAMLLQPGWDKALVSNLITDNRELNQLVWPILQSKSNTDIHVLKQKISHSLAESKKKQRAEKTCTYFLFA